MISKAALCHILVIWGLAQVTAQLNRGGIPSGVRSSMIANGWRPLTAFEGNNNAGPHPAMMVGTNSGGGTLIERYSGPHHPVHGKYQEHMAKSEKVMSSGKSAQQNDYSPPSILGSFSSVFGHSMTKLRGNSEVVKKPQGSVASETREYSFLVPPPPDPIRYDIDPFRKVILRDTESYPRQPGHYVISHGSSQSEVRNQQYYPSGGAAVAASSHTLTATKNRPLIGDYNGNVLQQPPRPQQVQQQHVPFESLKLPNTKLYLQPPSVNPANFDPPQRPSEEQRHHFERYPSQSLINNPHSQHLTPESTGNFYSQVNHPSPPGIYNTRTQLEKDPSFLVHESHEISYPTAAPLQSQPGFAAFGNFRPSTPFELHGPERFSTPRPSIAQTDNFVPSKPDNTRHKQEKYAQHSQNGGGANHENSIANSEYSNGINTYYISEQQSLTPPPPTWSLPAKTKMTPDINEVLPKANRPAKLNDESPNAEVIRPNLNLPNYLFPLQEIQQTRLQHPQYYPNNHFNQQPDTVFETPESISLKHFNEQQHRLQQQLLQRDRERLREQELQRQQQQIELGRLAAANAREREKELTTAPMPETPRPTIQYVDTTVAYPGDPINTPDIQRLPGQVYLRPEFQEFPFLTQRPDLAGPTIHGADNISAVDEVYLKVTSPPEKTSTQEATAAPSSSGHRTRPRKPSANHERRRKPAAPAYEESIYDHPQEVYHHSTLSPNPIVQSPGSVYSDTSSTEAPTTAYEASYPSVTTAPVVSEPSSISTRIPTTSSPPTTTQRPRSRRPSSGNLSAGRRRRPSSTTVGTTTTREPETTTPPVTYQHEEYTTYEKIEPVTTLKTTTTTTRRRKIKPTPVSQTLYEDPDPITSTEKKRFEIQNYGNKLGALDQDYITGSPESYSLEVEQVSPQQAYSYGNSEQDSSQYYTPTYDGQVTDGQLTSSQVTDDQLISVQLGNVATTSGQATKAQTSRGQASRVQVTRGPVTSGQITRGQVTAGQIINTQEYGDYETSAYPTSSSSYPNQGISGERDVDNVETAKNVFTNVPLEELFVDTEKTFTTTVPSTTTRATTTTTARTTTTTAAPLTRGAHSRTTSAPVSSPETVHTTRASNHRMRPMRFGNSTRPRFSIKDYKSRMDYRNRMSTTSEAPNTIARQKTGSSRNQAQEVSQPMESTTLRYRHMPRVSYRMPTTTPSYHGSRTRGETNDATTERTNRFTPKRRLHNSHLYRSKISSTTTTVEPSTNDAADANSSTRQNSVRNENVFSSSIRRRPHMKHTVFTQSSDSRTTTRREPTEMVPEETSFYTSAISQLLVTDPSSTTRNKENEFERQATNENIEDSEVTSTTEQIESSSTRSTQSSENADKGEPINVEDTNVSEYQQTTTVDPEPGQTEALVKDDHVTIDSQLEEDLFAKASQSVADLTSSASALYDKPGMFKAVSVAPSGAENPFMSSRFRINQENPTLPIEAFFQELSGKN